MKVERQPFGKGRATLYKLTNDNGLIMEVTDFGARIVRLFVPNKKGELQNILLGFDSEEEYLRQDTYFGATIGRVAGRIGQGEFLDKEKNRLHSFDKNEGNNTLHGGKKSFEEKIWETEIVEGRDEIRLTFSYLSPEGENGFAGNLAVKVEYVFTNANDWTLHYYAKTDQTTLFNPTNHVYFNLSGSLAQSINQHLLYIDGSKFIPINEESLPTGEIRKVEGTPFDFQHKEGRKVGQGFDTDYEQNTLVDGYDHPFVLDSPSLERAQGYLKDVENGIQLEIFTDAPSIVVYTTNIGEKYYTMFGEKVTKHCGITFETQILPDAIHHDGFGNIVLQPETVFNSTTRFKFS